MTFGCNIDYKGERYSLDVNMRENGETEYEVTSPESFEGMKFTVIGEKVIIEYSGLKVEKSLKDIPFGNAVLLFYGVLSDAEGKPLSQSEGEYTVSGEVSGIKYLLSATEEGLPVSINFKSEEIFMEFVKLTLVKVEK